MNHKEFSSKGGKARAKKLGKDALSAVMKKAIAARIKKAGGIEAYKELQRIATKKRWALCQSRITDKP